MVGSVAGSVAHSLRETSILAPPPESEKQRLKEETKDDDKPKMVNLYSPIRKKASSEQPPTPTAPEEAEEINPDEAKVDKTEDTGDNEVKKTKEIDVRFVVKEEEVVKPEKKVRANRVSNATTLKLKNANKWLSNTLPFLREKVDSGIDKYHFYEIYRVTVFDAVYHKRLGPKLKNKGLMELLNMWDRARRIMSTENFSEPRKELLEPRTLFFLDPESAEENEKDVEIPLNKFFRTKEEAELTLGKRMACFYYSALTYKVQRYLQRDVNLLKGRMILIDEFQNSQPLNKNQMTDVLSFLGDVNEIMKRQIKLLKKNIPFRISLVTLMEEKYKAYSRLQVTVNEKESVGIWKDFKDLDRFWKTFNYRRALINILFADCANKWKNYNFHPLKPKKLPLTMRLKLSNQKPPWRCEPDAITNPRRQIITAAIWSGISDSQSGNSNSMVQSVQAPDEDPSNVAPANKASEQEPQKPVEAAPPKKSPRNEPEINDEVAPVEEPPKQEVTSVVEPPKQEMKFLEEVAPPVPPRCAPSPEASKDRGLGASFNPLPEMPQEREIENTSIPLIYAVPVQRPTRDPSKAARRKGIRFEDPPLQTHPDRVNTDMKYYARRDGKPGPLCITNKRDDELYIKLSEFKPAIDREVHRKLKKEKRKWRKQIEMMLAGREGEDDSSTVRSLVTMNSSMQHKEKSPQKQQKEKGVPVLFQLPEGKTLNWDMSLRQFFELNGRIMRQDEDSMEEIDIPKKAVSERLPPNEAPATPTRDCGLDQSNSRSMSEAKSEQPKESSTKQAWLPWLRQMVGVGESKNSQSKVEGANASTQAYETDNQMKKPLSTASEGELIESAKEQLDPKETDSFSSKIAKKKSFAKKRDSRKSNEKNSGSVASGKQEGGSAVPDQVMNESKAKSVDEKEDNTDEATVADSEKHENLDKSAGPDAEKFPDDKSLFHRTPPDPITFSTQESLKKQSSNPSSNQKEVEAAFVSSTKQTRVESENKIPSEGQKTDLRDDENTQSKVKVVGDDENDRIEEKEENISNKNEPQSEKKVIEKTIGIDQVNGEEEREKMTEDNIVKKPDTEENKSTANLSQNGSKTPSEGPKSSGMRADQSNEEAPPGGETSDEKDPHENDKLSGTKEPIEEDKKKENPELDENRSMSKASSEGPKSSHPTKLTKSKSGSSLNFANLLPKSLTGKGKKKEKKQEVNEEQPKEEENSLAERARNL